ncbi:hypothetical protein QBC47DRAFT_373442 [Echria macrotheca]|uniref:Uncharacterized protein n=1 Tax=Echria macrotheca TaxID=438768 RepID=A0AAJ0FAE5_9PEZI|nr:hypothetical protein QBC47DRAFT_373442 [Echria macrotheca]
MIWCLAITKPLYCQASPMMQNWPGGCRITNIGMSDLAAKSDMIPGVGCGDNDAPVFFMGFIGFVCAVLACGFFLKIEPNTHLSLWIPGIVALGAVFFLILYPFFVVLAYMMDFFLTTLVVPFAYLTTYGRQCVFGPSNMIAFSELDQVFALVVGICAGVASIWDSVTAYRESFHGEVVVAENIEMSAAVAPAPSV